MEKKNIIPEVENLSFPLYKSKLQVVMLSYHKKSIKLANSFYWSLHTSLKNKKMGISGHLFEKYTCRDFLLNVINFRCTNFTMETLICLPVCDISIFINVTDIYIINTLFYSFTDKIIPITKQSFLNLLENLPCPGSLMTNG